MPQLDVGRCLAQEPRLLLGGGFLVEDLHHDGSVSQILQTLEVPKVLQVYAALDDLSEPSVPHFLDVLQGLPGHVQVRVPVLGKIGWLAVLFPKWRWGRWLRFQDGVGFPQEALHGEWLELHSVGGHLQGNFQLQVRETVNRVVVGAILEFLENDAFEVRSA